MKYVLDVSVALCWVIPRPLSPKALLLRDQYRNNVHELVAPSVYPYEVGNPLTKAERQKLISVGDARKMSRDVLTTPPLLQTTGLLFYRAVDISSQTRAGCRIRPHHP